MKKWNHLKLKLFPKKMRRKVDGGGGGSKRKTNCNFPSKINHIHIYLREKNSVDTPAIIIHNEIGTIISNFYNKIFIFTSIFSSSKMKKGHQLKNLPSPPHLCLPSNPFQRLINPK